MKSILMIISLWLPFLIQAQTDKTINVSTVGTLSSLISETELTTITNLTVTGNIDLRDFMTLRSISNLTILDLSKASIAAYLNENSIQFSANTIPDGIFESTKLISINFPVNLDTIGNNAFSSCYQLSSINIPPSVDSIGFIAFVACKGLYNVDSSNTKYSSESGVLFNKNKSVLLQYPTARTGNYIIPTSVSTIGYKAFFLCKDLTSVSIPSSVISIGNGALEFCTGLTEVKIPSSVRSIGDESFSGCENLVSVTIPTSVTSIGEYAFFECGFSSITIPSSVQSIGSSAFRDCWLNTVIVSNPTPIDLSHSMSVFAGSLSSNSILYVPVGSKAAYQIADQWKDFANIEELTPTEVETLNEIKPIIYPNPTINGFTVNTSNGSIIQIYSIKGVLLLSKETVNNEFISTTNLTSGFYIVKIINKNGITFQRLIIKEK